MRKIRVFGTILMVAFVLAACTAFGFDPPAPPSDDDEFLFDETPATLAPVSTSQVVEFEPAAEGTEKRLFEQSVVVKIDERWVSTNLITNNQFRLCVAAEACSAPDDNPGFENAGAAPLPVSGITAEQAQEYCAWLGGTLLQTSTYESLGSPTTRGAGVFLKPVGGDLQISVILLEVDGGFKLGNLVYTTDGDLPDFGSVGDYEPSPGAGFACEVGDPDAFTPLCEQVANLSTTSGDFPPGVCPEVSFDVNGTYCQNGLHYINVDLINAHEGFYTEPPYLCNEVVPDSEGTDPWKVYCQGNEGDSFTIGAYSQCTPPSGWQPDALCLNGYHYEAETGMCTYDGDNLGSGVCPDGFTLAPQNNCCAPAKDYAPTCPAGTVHSSTWGGCTPYEQTYELFTVTATFEKCEEGGGGGGGGGSCNLSCPSDCQPNPSCTACVTSGGSACKE